MNRDYWLGVLSAPALILALLAVWTLFCLGGWATSKLLSGGVIRMTKDVPPARRAAAASVVYAHDRVWVLAFGNVGVSFGFGLDHKRANRLARKLNSLDKIDMRGEYGIWEKDNDDA